MRSGGSHTVRAGLRIAAARLVSSLRRARFMRSSISGWMPRNSFCRRGGTLSPHRETADLEMPNCLPIASFVPNTATRSLTYMGRELSILGTRKSSTINRGVAKVAGLVTTLQDRLIEIAGTVKNDAELARLLGVSRSAVSLWREGRVKTLKAINALNIQERTGYSAVWLIKGVGPKRVSVSDSGPKIPPNLVPDLLVVISSFLDTDDEGRKEIVEAIGAIAGAHGSTGRQGRNARGYKRR